MECIEHSIIEHSYSIHKDSEYFISSNFGTNSDIPVADSVDFGTYYNFLHVISMDSRTCATITITIAYWTSISYHY